MASAYSYAGNNPLQGHRPLTLLGERSSIFGGANPHEVSEYVNRHVGNHILRLSARGNASARLSHRNIGSLDLCRLSYGHEARVMSEGLPDIYHIQFVLQGHCRFEVLRDTVELGAGQVMVINPEQPIDLTYSDDCEKFIVKIPAHLLDDACLEHSWCKRGGGIKFMPIPYEFAQLESLLVLLSLVCEEAESGLATPQMLQHYNRVAATKLMTLLKHNVCMEAAAAGSGNFDRLVMYIEQNIKRELTPEELAQQAHMSLRSLYMLFEKHVGTTPKSFIRQKKLEKAHAALNDATRQVSNVTAVALEYGFNHLGRFSDLYKAVFGVLPSETLRARRR